ncbi:hypothetical protein GA0070611_5737 [Micromonospora auratinigra]|uniref:Uncharacterized protein n=1 Tax=Micromonospora auratinigra TaxID=261654 RepID=A0A1A9A932_9ACTN|nr:hypothetical protein GA0070611_5737 [Micromonospora auratinigra]
MPRKKSHAGRTVVILLSVVALLLMCCCGGWFTYDGWWVPKQLQEQRRQIIVDAGAPSGFTGSGVVEGDRSATATYSLECERGVCPVNLAESLQTWLTDAGYSITVQEMRSCVADPGRPSCGV